MQEAKPGGPKYHSGYSFKGSHGIVPTPPVKVGNEHQLLMDAHVVEDSWACRRTVHRPEKHAENPVVTPREPWETSGPSYLTTLYDDETERYRIWATAYDVSRGNAKGELGRRGLYYESEEGVEWTAPHLGLVDVDGGTANNVFLGGGGFNYDNLGVLALPPEHRDKGRFAMLANRFAVAQTVRDTPEGRVQVRLAFSQDGLTWKDQPENPVIAGQSDTHNNFVYNPDRQVFMHYRRATINAHQIRRVAYSESPDLVHWTQPVIVIAPDEVDPPMLYAMTVSRYQGLYLGFLQNFYVGGPVGDPKEKMTDIQLAWSRDGISWERHPERPLFLETGPPGTYDWGMVRMGSGLIERGDDVRLYYSGANKFHVRMPGQWHGCLATLRRDRFVSLDDWPDTDGFMLTRPLECPGGELHVNARVGPNGYVKVAVRRGDGERDGEWLPDRGYEANVPVSGDSLDSAVRWSGQSGLDALSGKPIRLHFWLSDAELFSFWFE